MSMTEEQAQYLRRAFWYMNKYLMVPMWRLGLGKIINVSPEYVGQIMVITHKGRKSGKLYQTPVNYLMMDGDIYCTAGFGAVSDWYKNIMSDSNVEVWLPEGWWTGQAVDVTEDVDFLPMLRAILIASGPAAPLFGLDPKIISDEELEELSKDYRIVRIRRKDAKTGVGGPGEYAWVWVLTTFVFMFAYLFKPRKKIVRKK